jgi:hypothetical protein
VRNQYRNSYILYLLSCYRLKNQETKDLALKFLDDGSMYARNNALIIIRNCGDADLVIQALDRISFGSRYFNEKMLIDFFDSFAGDYSELSQKLVRHFDFFSAGIQRLIVQHFTNQRDGDSLVRDLMLRLLTSEDKELIIAAEKYFGWVTDHRADRFILQNIAHEEWEVRAISARISQRGYHITGMLDALKKGLSDPNWYVRQNCAYAYVSTVEGARRAILPIIEGSDKYAREVLLYVMFEKNYLGYELYQDITRYAAYAAAVAAGTAAEASESIEEGSWVQRAYAACQLCDRLGGDPDQIKVYLRDTDELTASALYFAMYLQDVIGYPEYQRAVALSEIAEKETAEKAAAIEQAETAAFQADLNRELESESEPDAEPELDTEPELDRELDRELEAELELEPDLDPELEPALVSA